MGVLRKTKSVKTLLHEFDHVKTPLSTRDLMERLGNQMNRSTVYRILNRLENDGILHSFIGRDGLAWYALSNKNHHSQSLKKNTHPHFQCLDCGKTECLPISVSIPEVSEHSVETVSLLLVGRCADCNSD
jgi:Fur family ferric uptake transcriptional regulator